jgi:DNA-binding transcriptional ArsR family regulator
MHEPSALFAAVADPTRRGILELLRIREHTAGELVEAFPEASQPGISRHLRVLRESGLVEARREEQRRIYSLRREGFAEFDAWISRYRAFWPTQLDALARHLDSKAAPTHTPSSLKKTK